MLKPASIFLPRLCRNQQGITSLEFALIAPVLVLFVMGIIEFSMIMYTTTIMESATNSTSRLGKTGYDPSGITREQAIINSIHSRTAGLLNPANLTLTTKVYADFNKVGKPEPCINPLNPPCHGTPGINYIDANGNGLWDSDMGDAGLGSAGEIVLYVVSYPWPITTPMIAAIMGNTYDITVRTVVRNEPFGS